MLTQKGYITYVTTLGTLHQCIALWHFSDLAWGSSDPFECRRQFHFVDGIQLIYTTLVKSQDSLESDHMNHDHVTCHFLKF